MSVLASYHARQRLFAQLACASLTAFVLALLLGALA